MSLAEIRGLLSVKVPKNKRCQETWCRLPTHLHDPLESVDFVMHVEVSSHAVGQQHNLITQLFVVKYCIKPYQQCKLLC